MDTEEKVTEEKITEEKVTEKAEVLTGEAELKKKKRSSFIKGIIAGLLICAIILGAGYMVFIKPIMISTKGATVAEDTSVKLTTLESIIRSAYLYNDKLDEKKLQDGVYKGFVDAVGDPYTVYYNEAETKELFESTEGEYSGIGAVLSQNIKTMEIVINNVYEDSPAEKGGLKNGDIIYKVDDIDVTDIELSEAVTWIRGEKGSKVNIGVIRNGKEITCEVIRDVIEAVTVSHEMMDGDIGYLRITEFDGVTGKQFTKQLAELESEGMKGLVIDLRANPGGNLDVTVEMLKEILPKGVIVSTKEKDGTEKIYENKEDNTFDKPLVVLVDGYTASASEIFSGAVKDYKVGTIVGTQTFGKGIVQSILDLQDGTSLKVTIAEYFTPSGENIHGKGITPDVVVEFPEDIEEVTSDIQLEKAVEIINNQLK